ncbi:SWIM zinc finger family protein [Microcoleus sp. N9_B4]
MSAVAGEVATCSCDYFSGGWDCEHGF